MRFDAPPLTATFRKRYKRFFADVELPDGSVLTAHCPNTGSLLGCKEEGSPVWLRDSGNEKRKLRFTWQAIRVQDAWVNVDTGLPNRVVAEAVEAGQVPALAGYDDLKREVKYGTNSRIDILLSDAKRAPCYVEVKSTTLIDGEAALFPDAVTERGRKHLHELIGEIERGNRAVQFFFVSRDDVAIFRPADEIDPDYCDTLRLAAEAGVELLAYTAKVEPGRIELGRPLEIELGGSGRRKKA